MSGFLTDEDMGWIDDIEAPYAAREKEEQAAQAAAEAPTTSAIVPLPLFPISGLAQAPDANGNGNFLTKPIAGLPVWGWTAIAAAVGTAGFFLWKSSSAPVKKNDGDEDSRSSEPEPEEKLGWSPSRTAVGDQLRRYFTRKGMLDRCTIYTDADDAKKKLKHVSPLLTIHVNGTYKVEKDLGSICKKEGLSPIAHEDGTIGLYPATGKRGKEWESYIDALRDEGQTV